MDQADIRTSVTSSDLWWAASAAGSWPISELAAPLIKVRLAGRSGLDSLSRNFKPPNADGIPALFARSITPTRRKV